MGSSFSSFHSRQRQVHQLCRPPWICHVGSRRRLPGYSTRRNLERHRNRGGVLIAPPFSLNSAPFNFFFIPLFPPSLYFRFYCASIFNSHRERIVFYIAYLFTGLSCCIYTHYIHYIFVSLLPCPCPHILIIIVWCTLVKDILWMRSSMPQIVA